MDIRRPLALHRLAPKVKDNIGATEHTMENNHMMRLKTAICYLIDVKKPAGYAGLKVLYCFNMPAVARR
ncbi:MAG TPA: hypothetical protein VJY31_05630 [Buttiauxella sp.]|nr:hypothetical protein [Buttiauxella sp.]